MNRKCKLQKMSVEEMAIMVEGDDANKRDMLICCYENIDQDIKTDTV